MRESGLTYTLSVGSYSLTINPSGWGGSGWFAAPDGIIFQSGVNPSVVSRPNQHGSWIDAAWRDGLAGSFTLYNMAADSATRQSQSDAMMKILDQMLGDGSATRQISGLQLTNPPAWATVGGTLKSVSFTLQTEKPYAELSSSTNYDTASMTATGGGFTVPLTIPFTLTGSGAGTATVTNTGNTDAYPTIQVYGPLSAFTIVNSNSGYRLAFPNGSIASGDYWTIDLFARSVYQNASTVSMLSALDLSQSTWFGFAPGDTSIQVSGSGYDSNSKVRVVMAGAFL